MVRRGAQLGSSPAGFCILRVLKFSPAQGSHSVAGWLPMLSLSLPLEAEKEALTRV